MNTNLERRKLVFGIVFLALCVAACVCTSTTGPIIPVDNTEESTNENEDNSGGTENENTPQDVNTGDRGETGDNTGVQPTGPTEETGDLTREEIDRIARAAVLVAIVGPNGRLLGNGSGTIISEDGEIVTNCHVACGAARLDIYVTTDPDLPPEPMYQAEIMAYSPPEEFDLALLKITRDANGNPIEPHDLPFVTVGDSDELALGDKLFIFGYPGIGGSTITFTTGTVGGFETVQINNQIERLYIKTEADVAHGNSGGTAVNVRGELIGVPTRLEPDRAGGVTWSVLSVLMPINLVRIVRAQGQGAPPVQEGGEPSVPPAEDPDQYEPNDSLEQATGPAPAGQPIQAFLSWDQDIDVYYVTTTTAQPISITLTGPANADYDLYLVDTGGNLLAESEGNTSDESIQYTPYGADTFYVVVLPYSGATVDTPYELTIGYDGVATGGGSGGGGGGQEPVITITGQIVDGATGNGIRGGVFGLLYPDATCDAFLAGSSPDVSLVLVADETRRGGDFELLGVPVGHTYSAFFIYEGSTPACNDGWLDVPADAQSPADIGVIEISLQ